MKSTLTLQLSSELTRQLTQEAERLNISPEEFVLQSLTQSLQQVDDEDESKESILNSLRISLQEIKEGKILPVEQLWDGIDD